MAIEGITGIDSDKEKRDTTKRSTRKSKSDVSKISFFLRNSTYDELKKICYAKNISIKSAMSQLAICLICAETDKDVNKLVEEERLLQEEIKRMNKESVKKSRANSTAKKAQERLASGSNMYKNSKAKNLYKENPYKDEDAINLLIHKTDKRAG